MTERMKISLQGLGYLAMTLILAIAAARVVGERGGYAPSDSLLVVPYFLVLVLLATLILYLALRASKSAWPFQVVFVLAIWAGSSALFDIFLPPPWGFLAGLIVAYAYFRRPSNLIANLSLSLALAGLAGAVVSGLRPTAIAVIFTILAFYDIVAVYVTGHMVRLFRGLTDRGVQVAYVLKGASEPAFYLGSGDVALPALLAASVARESLAGGLAVALGALLGCLLMFRLFFSPVRRPMPALPPIALGSLSAYLISLLLLP